MQIRVETPGDRDSIDELNRAAFDGPAEADLIEALRLQARPTVSLVATKDEQVVGHIMFSPAKLSAEPELAIMALGPMAVSPAHQRTGIGSALIEAGLEACRELGAAAVFVIGHASYYPRFGFVPAVRFGIDSDYDVPPEVFMALELEPGALAGKAGRLTYHEAFAGLD